MFTGIIEAQGKIKQIEKDGENVIFTVVSELSPALKVDQSLSHNGVCLTVTWKDEESHKVTVVKESLLKSNLGELKEGDLINLERSMRADGMLDGHIVQGHVDGVGICKEIQEVDGSWYFTFSFDPSFSHLIVNKGSICINGVSLTVIDPSDQDFRVAIIPYTYKHTNFLQLEVGSTVNLEFDILGKYVARILSSEF